MSAYEPGECTGTLSAPMTGSRTPGKDELMTGECPVCHDQFTLRAGLLIPSHQISERPYSVRAGPGP